MVWTNPETVKLWCYIQALLPASRHCWYRQIRSRRSNYWRIHIYHGIPCTCCTNGSGNSSSRECHSDRHRFWSSSCGFVTKVFLDNKLLLLLLLSIIMARPDRFDESSVIGTQLISRWIAMLNCMWFPHELLLFLISLTLHYVAPNNLEFSC